MQSFDENNLSDGMEEVDDAPNEKLGNVNS